MKKELEQLDKTLIVEALSPSESIKYNLIKAFYFSDIATNISINPTNFSQKALAIAEKHSDEIPSELYLVTLYLNVKTIEKYQGFSIDYFKMVQKSHIYLSKVNFSVDKNGVMTEMMDANGTAQVCPLELATKLIAAVQAFGSSVIISRVSGIVNEGGQVTGVRYTDSEHNEYILPASKVVIATGPWAGVHANDWLGLSVPIQVNASHVRLLQLQCKSQLSLILH